MTGVRQDLLITFGLKIMNNNRTLSAMTVRDRMAKFFKGCRSVKAMRTRIDLNGGFSQAACLLAEDEIRIYRLR